MSNKHMHIQVLNHKPLNKQTDTGENIISLVEVIIRVTWLTVHLRMVTYFYSIFFFIRQALTQLTEAKEIYKNIQKKSRQHLLNNTRNILLCLLAPKHLLLYAFYTFTDRPED